MPLAAGFVCGLAAGVLDSAALAGAGLAGAGLAGAGLAGAAGFGSALAVFALTLPGLAGGVFAAADLVLGDDFLSEGLAEDMEIMR